MSLVPIEESGMYFGPYERENLFHIEKATFYKKINDNVKVVEFMVFDDKNRLILIEARSSSPQPHVIERFDEYICDICDKFSHSINMLFSLLSNRLENMELPERFKQTDYSTIEIVLYLVIRGHKAEWLSPINEALTKKILPYKKIWRFRIIALNDEIAYEQKLISRTI